MDFRKTVKYRLIDLEKTQKWLEEQVREKTGLFVDSSYLHKIYTGERSAPKIVQAIKEILGIPDTAEAEEDAAAYRAWQQELAQKGVEPEVLLARYEAAGMTDYAKQVRAVIRRMEGSA